MTTAKHARVIDRKPNARPIDLAVQQVLAACLNSVVPVNLPLDVAISAHKQCELSQSPARWDANGCALRAIVCARTPTIEDTQAQLDYLTAQPLSAWPTCSQETPAAVRDATLQGIASTIACMQSN